MNIDIEDLVCFAYEQTNKITTVMTRNHYGEGNIEHLTNAMPDVLIQFLLEDQQKLAIRRRALDMHTNILAAKLEFAGTLWRSQSNLETKDEAVQNVLGLLKISLIKKAVLTYEKQMEESVSAAFSSDPVPTNKIKL